MTSRHEPRGGPGGSEPASGEGRWNGRPALARTLRAVVFLGPVALSLAAAWVAARTLPPVSGLSLLGLLGRLAILLVVSTVVLLATDRLVRRLLPIATLLDLSMLFPNQAPQRLAVARQAIRRRPIEEQLQRIRRAGGDPAEVARQILSLVAAMSYHDRPTRGHAERVRMFTDLIADQMGVAQRDRDLLRWAAILHDVGKLRVPTEVLNKPGKPDDAEWAILRSHPEWGAQIATALLPWLGQWGDVIVQHHERWDGTGYPQGLAGEQICEGARIVSVADAYDVMTAARAYKRPISRSAAIRELVRCSGTQFDPVVVRAMVSVSAPRLRRAQGLVAWLGDIPLLASNTVPAATLARVIGAGVLATGAGGLAAVPGMTPSPATPAGPVAAAVPGGAAAQTPPTALLPSKAPLEASGVQGAAAAAAASSVSAGGPTSPSPPATGTPSPKPPVPANPPLPGALSVPGVPIAPVPAPAPLPPPGPVGGVVGTVTGTVGSVVGAAGGVVSAATGAVVGTASAATGTLAGVVSNPAGAVANPVGTVTGAVGAVTAPVTGTVGTVTKAVGGLLGK